jgi:hypothetical protein
MHNDLSISVSLGAVPLHLHASALALPFLLQPAFRLQSFIPLQCQNHDIIAVVAVEGDT